jgi:hypothetical protein
VIDLVEKSQERKGAPRLPGGWYDPDSSAFEPLTGAAAVNDAVASSLEADRRIDAPEADDEDD